MKKKVLLIAAAIMLVAVMALTLVGCAYGSERTINTTFKHEINDNLHMSGMSEGLLNNADRGFRGEVYITLGRGVAYPSGKDDPYALLDKQLNIEGANIKVVQTYVYLIEYADKDIPESALDEMKKFFIAIRDSGAKMLLRFAYEYTDTLKIGPTTDRMVSHCAQLKGWIDSNMELFMDSVYAVQLGMIGLWGEGHASVYKHKVSRVIKAVCDMVPESITVMVRTPAFYKQASPKYKSRLTIHDDFLVGIEHSWGIGLKFNSAEYKQLTNMTKRRLTDGEMPWGRDETVADINLKKLVMQIRDYGLTTLSLTHNYLEMEGRDDFELNKARTEYITKDELDAEKFPYNPLMLKDDKITYFDYINYHLGYQISLSNWETNKKGTSFMVNNYGMACPIGYKMEVMADTNIALSISAADMKLYQFGQYKVHLKGDYSAAKISVRFVSERDGSTITLANNLINNAGEYYLN